MLRVSTPGAGGYGETAERSPDLVEQDIRFGKISAAAFHSRL
jgi:N-methylhydantoinase B/oxoprolinase/acetone carboxylase alpha subunit